MEYSYFGITLFNKFGNKLHPLAEMSMNGKANGSPLKSFSSLAQA